MNQTSTPTKDLPRGKRYRSFYRAVKRREAWALKIWALRDNPIQYCFALMYRRVDWSTFVYARNPFLDLISKEPEGFQGKYFPIPIIYGDKK